MVAKRSYPTVEVSSSGPECRAETAQEWPRGATPILRSGGEAERRYPLSKVRGSGQEEIPHALKPEARGGGREEQPHVQGAVAARAQEGREELTHVEGQEGWR